MTRKYYESIAANIKWQMLTVDSSEAFRYDDAHALATRNVLRNLASDMCATFSADNPRFDKAKFMTAAGF